ncbi:MAG: alpha/beta hydrolase family protein [Gammaproteobacteria bacterium]
MHYGNRKGRGVNCLCACALVATLVSALDAAHADGRLAPDMPYNQARAAFKTKLVNAGVAPDGPPAAPPAGVFELVEYSSPAGKLAAYLTPAPSGGPKLPALIWARGGHGGIGEFAWDTAEGYLGRALASPMVVMVPSWRGDNANPGRVEMFLGEVDDALAAIDFVAALPYVDAERIYMAGHSTGGTMTMLTAIASDKLRAVFSFGGVADTYLRTYSKDYRQAPFDQASYAEAHIRSAVNYAHELRTPTFYFEGEKAWDYVFLSKRMQGLAELHGTPFAAFEIKGSDHFKHVRPLMDLMTVKILADTGARMNIRVDASEVQQRFDKSASATR